VRLTVWFSLVFLFTSIVLFGLTMAGLYRTLLFEDRRALETRVLGYWAEFESAVSEEAGITQIVNDVQRESASGVRPYFIRIATAENNDVFVRIPLVEWQLAFDLSILFNGSDPHREGFVTIPSDIVGYDLEVLGYPLSDRYILQIGMETETRSRILRFFRTSFLVTFAVLAAVSVLGGLFFVSRSLRPISSLSATIRRIIQTGEFNERIPRTSSGDDLDDLVVSFNHMLQRVDQLVRGMRDALDAVAHDLRTPMTRFRATAETALAGAEDTGRYREALSDALEESEQILRMLNSMMEISEAEAGVMTLRREEIDVSKLVGEVADVYSLVAEEAGMTISTELAAGLTVSADPGRLRQVVGNLLDNALKYGTCGTAVEVRLATAPCADHGSCAVLRVRNQGRGISEDDMPNIWSRLFRGADTARTEGIGLGLTLVKAVVETHGGTVDAESVPGEYAAFTVRLPLAERES
jgi:signal transduction histidine kinase